MWRRCWWFLVPGTWANMEDWSCNFIGNRFARTFSHCDNEKGICDDIFKLGHNMIVPGSLPLGGNAMSCVEAVQLASRTVQDINDGFYSDPWGITLDLSVETLTRRLQSVVIPQIRESMFRSQPFSAELSALLRGADVSFAVIFVGKRTRFQFSQELAEALNDLQQEIDDLVSLNEDAGSETAHLLNRVFELLSWLGYQKSPTSMANRKLIQDTLPENFSCTILNTERAVQYTDLIDRLVDRCSSGEGSAPFVTRDMLSFTDLVWLLSLPNREANATESLMIGHLRTALGNCMHELANCFPSRIKLWQYTMLQLARMVRGHVPIRTIVEASMVLHRGPELLIVPKWSITEVSADVVMRSTSGFLSSWVAVRDNVPGYEYFLEVLHVIIDKNKIFSNGTFKRESDDVSFRKACISIGRGIGLLVFRGTRDSFGHLIPLSPEVKMMIHTLPQDAENIVREAVYFIREGVRNVIGPIGVGVYTAEQWRTVIEAI